MVDTESKDEKTSKASVVQKSTKVEPTKGDAKEVVAEKNMKAAPVERTQPVEVASKSKNAMINIKQIGSPIRRDPRQALYLKSLGLGKLNRVRKIVDNASTRGLLDKLQHMVVVLEQ